MQLQWFFFNALEAGDWIEPLREAGLLGEPLRLTEDGEVRTYGEWPAGRYLLRMAASDQVETRSLVVEVLQSLANAEHPDVLLDGIGIIAALPAAEAAPIVGIAVDWMRRDTRVLHQGASSDLIKHLAEAAESAAALSMARETFRIWGDGRQIKSHHVDQMYEYHLPLLRGLLTSACGLGALELLVELLQQAITIQGIGGYSHLSMRVLRETDGTPIDITDMLIAAVKDTAHELAENEAASMVEIVSLLRARHEGIFARLALHVLAIKPDEAPELATAYLLDQDLITAPWCALEYAALALEWYPSLSPEQQATILLAIDAVPALYLDTWKERFEQQQKAPPTADDVHLFEINCVRELTWAWREVLPPDRRAVLEKAGDPNAWRRQVEKPDESPMTRADFSTRPVPEVIAFLRTWQPAQDAGRYTLAALAQEVRSAAADHAGPYSNAAAQFAGLRPLYIRRLAEGLKQAATNRKPIDWASVLLLIASVYDQASSGNSPSENEDNDDSSWEWSLKASADLLMTGLRLGSFGIGIEHLVAVRVFVARTMALVPAKTEVEDFDRRFEESPFFAAQQTLRGIATQLCVLFVHWRNARANLPRDTVRASLGGDPDIAAVLDQLLVDRSASGVIPRSIIGRYLQVLAHLDEEWIRSRMAVLVPEDDVALRQALWRSHLMHDGGPALALTPELTGCYLEEIDRLSLGADDGHFRRQRLAEYLMVLVLWGSAPTSILGRFHERASDKLRRQAMWFMGNQVSVPANELPDHVRQRGLAYWEGRLAAAVASTDRTSFRSELGAIDHWCSLGAIDEVWLSDQLLALSAIGLLPRIEYLAAEWLARLADNHIERAVEILLRLVERPGGSRENYMSNQGPIRSILSKGREKGTSETAARVSTIVSHFAALGETAYLDLALPKARPEDS